MNLAALIPARGGSKRVKNKNTRVLGEHPLIAYTIAAARQSGIFDAIIVSTDIEPTQAIARYYGAESPFLRPPEYAIDTSPDIKWIEHTLTRLQAEGRTFDAFSILRPTSPFRQPDTIRRAWQQFTNTPNIDSLRAVEKCTQHPGKMWVISGEHMTPLLLSPQGVPWHSTPYQALPPVYVQNASLEIAYTRVVFEEHSITGNILSPFITTDTEGFDINNEMDWLVAEILVGRNPELLPVITLPPYERHNSHG